MLAPPKIPYRAWDGCSPNQAFGQWPIALTERQPRSRPASSNHRRCAAHSKTPRFGKTARFGNAPGPGNAPRSWAGTGALHCESPKRRKTRRICPVSRIARGPPAQFAKAPYRIRVIKLGFIRSNTASSTTSDRARSGWGGHYRYHTTTEDEWRAGQYSHSFAVCRPSENHRKVKCNRHRLALVIVNDAACLGSKQSFCPQIAMV